MARNNYPGSKTEPGIVIAYNCSRGGWVVLYDRKKADLGIRTPLNETGRYILVHRPSANSVWPFENLPQAKQWTRAAAKGEDPTGGLFPRTAPATKAEKAAAEFIGENDKSGAGTPARSDKPPPTTANASDEGITSTSPSPEDFHLEFKRRMAEKFTAEVIVQKLDDLLNATKPVSLQNLDSGERESIDTPDWMAREKGIRIVVEMNEGKAKERPDIKEPVKRSFADLKKMCQTSPKARTFLKQQLEEWDREARLHSETTHHASGTAKTKV